MSKINLYCIDRKFKISVLATTLFIFSSSNGVAQERPQGILEKGLALINEESSVSVRYRNEHKANNSLHEDQLQYRVDIKMKFQLTSDNKLFLKTRVLTGGDFDSAWNDSDIGKVDGDGNILPAIRHLYIDYSPTSNVNLQVGAIPVTGTDLIGQSPLSIDTDGWVDGARASYSKLASWADKIVVTIGQMDEYEDTNFFSRQWGSPNYIQVHIQGDLSRHFKYATEVTKLNQEKNLRGILEITLKDLVSFIDTVAIEEMISLDQSNHKGFGVTLKKSINNWKFSGGYVYKRAYMNEQSNTILLNDFYVNGHQVFLQVEKKQNGVPHI